MIVLLNLNVPQSINIICVCVSVSVAYRLKNRQPDFIVEDVDIPGNQDQVEMSLLRCSHVDFRIIQIIFSFIIILVHVNILHRDCSLTAMWYNMGTLIISEYKLQTWGDIRNRNSKRSVISTDIPQKVYPIRCLLLVLHFIALVIVKLNYFIEILNHILYLRSWLIGYLVIQSN